MDKTNKKRENMKQEGERIETEKNRRVDKLKVGRHRSRPIGGEEGRRRDGRKEKGREERKRGNR